MTGEGIPGLMKTVNDLLKASDILNQQPGGKSLSSFAPA